jgi:hypothetical protein
LYKDWRRERDLNPRYEFYPVHTISSRAPSAARTSLLVIVIAYPRGPGKCPMKRRSGYAEEQEKRVWVNRH